jgi:hypothetical protein
VKAGVLVDFEKLVDDQRRIFVRHGQVHARLDDLAGFYRGRTGGAC